MCVHVCVCVCVSVARVYVHVHVHVHVFVSCIIVFWQEQRYEYMLNYVYFARLQLTRFFENVDIGLSDWERLVARLTRTILVDVATCCMRAA